MIFIFTEMKRANCAHSVVMTAGTYDILNSQAEQYVYVPVLCVYIMQRQTHELHLKSFLWNAQQKVCGFSYKLRERIFGVDTFVAPPALDSV